MNSISTQYRLVFHPFLCEVYEGVSKIKYVCVKLVLWSSLLWLILPPFTWGYSYGLYSLQSFVLDAQTGKPSSIVPCFFVYNVNLYMTEVSSILYHYMTLLTRSEHISNLTFFLYMWDSPLEILKSICFGMIQDSLDFLLLSWNQELWGLKNGLLPSAFFIKCCMFLIHSIVLIHVLDS